MPSIAAPMKQKAMRAEALVFFDRACALTKMIPIIARIPAMIHISTINTSQAGGTMNHSCATLAVRIQYTTWFN
ncbi:MAG TPA: hypothetical protein PLX97_12450, partial [Gemmatales bacterium]|nr:hypothetical protein [Gemmatales bacterium]